MAGIKNLTVRYLRELARKHLGRGHSKLKTKEELVAALRKIVPALLGGDAEGKERVSAETPARPRNEARPAEVVRFEKPARTAAPEASTHGRASVVPLTSAAPAAAAAAKTNGVHRPTSTDTAVEVHPVPAEPLVEGFFVARVAGEDEARRHHLTEDQVRPPLETRSALHYDEHLAEIPWEYQDDRVVLLPRDPHTLHVYWDFHPNTRTAAFQGLASPRAWLRVFEGGREVRSIELALESRSYYVHGLPAARTYRVELHAVGQDGSWRRIGPSSNEVTLPADDVSSDTSVRFLRVPWGVPLNRLKEGVHTGRVTVQTPEVPPEPLVVTHFRWVPLPTSGSWQLQAWQERVPRPEGAAAAGGGGEKVEYVGFPVGGASSSSLQGSWHVGGSWQMSSSWMALPSSPAWPPSGRGE